jgi:hypothetical protein
MHIENVEVTWMGKEYWRKEGMRQKYGSDKGREESG